MPLTSNETEAMNRAEAIAIFIMAGFKVYRPEADVNGEDLVVQAPCGELRLVQMKARPTVQFSRYGGRNLWMLFPDPTTLVMFKRMWFFVKHDDLFAWCIERYGKPPKDDYQHFSRVPKRLFEFLQPHILYKGE